MTEPRKTDLAPLRAFVHSLLGRSDRDCLIFQRLAQGDNMADISRTLFDIAGQVDRIAAAMEENPKAARDFMREAVAPLRRFPEIAKAIAQGEGRWTRGAGAEKVIKYKYQTAKEYNKARTERQEKLTSEEVNLCYTLPTAAAKLGITRGTLRYYMQIGKVVAVYRNGQRKACAVTRFSVHQYQQRMDAAKKRREMNASTREAERREREAIRAAGGRYYTEDGRAIYGDEHISATDAVRLLGVSGRNVLWGLSCRGLIRRVYQDAGLRHCVGYERATVYELAATRSSSTYYTASGEKITGPERISMEDAAKEIGCGLAKVSNLANIGRIERTFADKACRLPCGLVRASVAQYVANAARRIRAKDARAVADFHIEELPPPPPKERPQGLRARRLEPCDDDERRPRKADAANTEKPRKRRGPVFTLTASAISTTTTPDGEKTMQENAETEKTGENANGKLQVAKAYTVHDHGVIKAICVSEEDRDEIVAALNLYRRAKAAKPGEVESALALLHTIRAQLGITDGEKEPDAERQADDADGGAQAADEAGQIAADV